MQRQKPLFVRHMGMNEESVNLKQLHLSYNKAQRIYREAFLLSVGSQCSEEELLCKTNLLNYAFSVY